MSPESDVQTKVSTTSATSRWLLLRRNFSRLLHRVGKRKVNKYGTGVSILAYSLTVSI